MTHSAADAERAEPFASGAVVILTLAAPREKFWGALLSINPAGVTLAGIDLNSFEDFLRMLKAGDPATATTLFFPMHRVERMEIDSPSGGLPSLSERFQLATGERIEAMLGLLPRSVTRQ
jgi:hypothetical protein